MNTTGEPVPDAGVSPPPAADDTTGERHGPWFYLCLIAGWSVIIFGLHGILSNRGASPLHLFRLLIGLNVVNDALVIPLLLVLAVAVRRLAPRWIRVPLDVGLIASGAVILYAYPLVGSWGKSVRAGDSRLPWNYAHGLAIVLGCIWFVCALMAVWSWRRTRSNPR